MDASSARRAPLRHWYEGEILSNEFPDGNHSTGTTTRAFKRPL